MKHIEIVIPIIQSIAVSARMIYIGICRTALITKLIYVSLSTRKYHHRRRRGSAVAAKKKRAHATRTNLCSTETRIKESVFKSEKKNTKWPRNPVNRPFRRIEALRALSRMLYSLVFNCFTSKENCFGLVPSTIVLLRSLCHYVGNSFVEQLAT